MISDETFLEDFEQQTLDPTYFDHLGHLRLAWLYINRYAVDQAVEKVTGGIAAYANSLGARDKFQQTLTEATVRIMAKRCFKEGETSFKAFLAPDIAAF